MTKPWPKVKLGGVLRQRPLDTQVEPLTTYQFAGVYSFGRGVFRGQAKSGSEFSYPKLTRLRAGDFLYPKLMAWEGAFGVAPAACEGCVVSPEFPVFEPVPERLDTRFLGHYFSRPSAWEALSEKSTGTNVRRRRLHPESFLRSEIPLPPLAEQQRIVARIEELNLTTSKAVQLRTESVKESAALLGARETEIWGPRFRGPRVELGRVTTFLARGRQAEQGDSDHVLIKSQHVQMRHYRQSVLTLAPHAAQKVSPASLAREGDVLIACSAAGCLGRVARFQGTGIKASTDTHVAIARADTTVVDAHYLYKFLASVPGQMQLRSRERGDWEREKIGFRLAELNLRDLQRVPVPLPPLEEQHQIALYLDALQVKAAELDRLQSRTAAELHALMPAILDRAFRGEL